MSKVIFSIYRHQFKMNMTEKMALINNSKLAILVFFCSIQKRPCCQTMIVQSKDYFLKQISDSSDNVIRIFLF